MKEISYTVNDGVITFNKPIKGRGAIKIYFFREVDERATADFPRPFVTADGNGTPHYQWINGFKIHAVHVRVRKFFGLLGSKWVIANKQSA